MQFGERVKIGTTSNLRARMQVVPNERILVTEPGSYALEKQRHREFRHCWVIGEWFRADDALLQEHVAKLRKAHGWGNW